MCAGWPWHLPLHPETLRLEVSIPTTAPLTKTALIAPQDDEEDSTSRAIHQRVLVKSSELLGASCTALARYL